MEIKKIKINFYWITKSKKSLFLYLRNKILQERC